jgi:microcompartment protein CcmL/EutN
MQSSIQVIKVTQTEVGWSWTLVKGDGATVASGMACGQQAAMETAWGQARSIAPRSLRAYPEVIVEAPARTAR